MTGMVIVRPSTDAPAPSVGSILNKGMSFSAASPKPSPAGSSLCTEQLVRRPSPVTVQAADERPVTLRLCAASGKALATANPVGRRIHPTIIRNGCH